MPGRPAAVIHQNKDGSVTLQYQPSEKGIHELNLVYNDKPLDGMPFRCHVDAAGGGFVTAYGDGLSFGSSGSKCEFCIVGGGGKLDISVHGASKADLTKDVKDGITRCSYVPMSPGEYFVEVKVGGKHIQGSPFSAKITGEGQKRSQISFVATSELGLGPMNPDLANIQSKLKLPGGATEPCLLKKLKDGQLGISCFRPQSAGTYEVDVLQDGKAMRGSPFKISVGADKVCCAAKVKVSGNGIKSPMANTWNEVTLDCTHAGYGSLGVSIEGAHRSDMQKKQNGDAVYTLSFKPHEPGIYLLNIRFGDDHVPGSPYVINAGGEASGRIREKVEKQINAVSPTMPGSKAQLLLKIPGTEPLDMEASLTSPTGKTELCDIADLPGSLYDIKFTPEMEGVHTVSLKYKGLHISGSPFQYTVGPPPNAGPHKVEIGGPGLEKGEVGMMNEFNIYTREAGAGNLLVAVEGPSKAKLEVVDRGNGYTTVGYDVTKPGEYGVHVKYDDEHVPDSPAVVYVAPESGDAKKCTIAGLRDRGLDIGKPANFTVNLNGAKGDLRAFADTPSETVEDVFIQELDEGYNALRFIPKENGIYYVHIKLNEAHIPGSPFPMQVGKKGADVALVLARGDGMEKGVSGKAAKFVVVTADAGMGVLAVSLEGPSKCAIVCQEVEEGYEFSYTPMAPGAYLVNIKFCNITIAGCPSKAIITGSGKPSTITEKSSLVVETVEKKAGQKASKRFTGNAEKVVAKGNGLKKAFINRPVNFNVEVKDAGNALLLVGIITPTGNPVEEMTVKKMKPGVFQVVYKTKEKGDHTMSIRWGSDEIPGSPFTISVG